MSEDRAEYFIAKGRSLEIVTKAENALRDYFNLWNEVGKELGAENTWQSSTQVYGWSFPQGMAVPEGLRIVQKSPRIYGPNRMRNGEALRARLKTCPNPGSSYMLELFPLPEQRTNYMGNGFHVGFQGSSMLIQRASTEHIGDTVVIRVPIPYNLDKAPVPVDAEPLARSAYWAMKEKVSEAA